MGIEGLWKLLDGATQRPSLRTLSIREGFEGPRADRLFYIGVDLSIWMQQLQHIFVKGHAQAGENPELRTFFYRLAMLAERPVHLIFVMDGPLRPTLKRKKHVRTTPHWLTEGMRRFIEAFGYEWLEAAGEAEAELARMNELGIVDAVLTEDSDALVFGARTVIRNPSFKRTDPDIVTVCRAADILDSEGLTRGDLLLLALLLGSDYDPSGLPRCGASTARGLVRYGLGRSLYSALSSHEGLDEFLPRWRAQLCAKLRMDPNGFIGRRHPSLADCVPPTFPNVAVARLFMSPAVLHPDQYARVGSPRSMDLPQLGSLCELYFTWGSQAEILKTFRTALWPGEAVRMLVNEGVAHGDSAVRTRQLLSLTIKHVEEPAAIGYTLCRAELGDIGFAQIAAESLRGMRPYRRAARLSEEDAYAEAAKPLKVRIPALIVERARPLLVNPRFSIDGYQYGRVLQPHTPRHDGPLPPSAGSPVGCARGLGASPSAGQAYILSQLSSMTALPTPLSSPCLSTSPAVPDFALSPVSSTVGPACSTATPGHTTTAPTCSTTASMHSMPLLRSATTEPTHATTASAHAMTVSAHAMTASAHTAAAPANATAAPANATAAPAHATAVPASATIVSARATTVSARTTTMSAHTMAVSTRPTDVSTHSMVVSTGSPVAASTCSTNTSSSLATAPVKPTTTATRATTTAICATTASTRAEGTSTRAMTVFTHAATSSGRSTTETVCSMAASARSTAASVRSTTMFARPTIIPAHLPTASTSTTAAPTRLTAIPTCPMDASLPPMPMSAGLTRWTTTPRSLAEDAHSLPASVHSSAASISSTRVSASSLMSPMHSTVPSASVSACLPVLSSRPLPACSAASGSMILLSPNQATPPARSMMTQMTSSAGLTTPASGSVTCLAGSAAMFASSPGHSIQSTVLSTGAGVHSSPDIIDLTMYDTDEDFDRSIIDLTRDN